MYLQTFKDYKSSKPYIDIGVDAISDEFTENYLFSRISQIRSNLCIKVFLLDQKQVGGIGNIYVSEILFAVGIHPLSLVKKITSNDVQKIVFHTKRILADSIDCGGTSIID